MSGWTRPWRPAANLTDPTDPRTPFPRRLLHQDEDAVIAFCLLRLVSYGCFSCLHRAGFFIARQGAGFCYRTGSSAFCLGFEGGAIGVVEGNAGGFSRPCWYLRRGCLAWRGGGSDVVGIRVWAGGGFVVQDFRGVVIELGAWRKGGRKSCFFECMGRRVLPASEGTPRKLLVRGG